MATMVKRILCLANSRKGGDRCVAGREILASLDVVDVPVIKASPQEYQRENWLLDPERRWERVCRLAPSALVDFTTREAQLWVSGYCSSEGENDRIPSSIAIKLPSSLRLIRVDRMDLSVRTHDSGRRMRGRFRYAQTGYSLRVTDPVCEQRYKDLDDGDYPVGESYLTVSLGEPYDGYSYKLIAAVIESKVERSTT